MKKLWIVLASLICLAALTGMFSMQAFAANEPETPIVYLCTHNWGAVTYEWSEDNATCTAKRTCSFCSLVQSETAEAACEVTTPATEETDGERLFTATFKNTAFVQQTATGNIPAGTAVVWGDVNGDGKVSAQDVIRLKNYLANFDYETETSSFVIDRGSDANGDGKVNAQDVIRLKNYLANYDYDKGESSYKLGPEA